jgi:hypothetical protein
MDNDRPNLSSERMLYKDYDRRCSIEKKILAVSLKASNSDSVCLSWWDVFSPVMCCAACLVAPGLSYQLLIAAAPS